MVLWFFLERYDGEFLVNWREIKERNWGASMLADERDTIKKELQREEEPHDRVIVAVAVIVTAERMTGVLRSFARRR